MSLKNNFPYPWTKDSITYLGIKRTFPITNIYNINYSPLVTTIQQELSRIQNCFLTWSGRLAAYKMLILPKLLYYFRTLPIPIPSSFFTTMQKQILNFVWTGKKARCSSHLQSRHKSVRGMGLPLLKDYYTAAVLDQLKNWFTNPTTKPWCQIELAWLNSKSPLPLLVASYLSKDNKISNHPTIQATTQAWSKLRSKGYAFYSTTNIPIPLESLKWTIPNIRLHKWLGNNILNLADITMGDRMLPFRTIQQKFNIPNSELLTYTQISSYYQRMETTHV